MKEHKKKERLDVLLVKRGFAESERKGESDNNDRKCVCKRTEGR